MFNLWKFVLNTGNKILNSHLVKTPMKTDITENSDNEYILGAIAAIRENNIRLDIKATKDHINKNFVTDVDE